MTIDFSGRPAFSLNDHSIIHRDLESSQVNCQKQALLTGKRLKKGQMTRPM
jgi:hypothetical protein